jgi:deoxyribodipyrimidine photo-lyase
VSLPQVLEAVLQKGYKLHEIEKWLQELAWREYYQRVWQVKQTALQNDLTQSQPGVLHHRMVNALEQASTGITVIDEQINSLYKTGYMHNHVRMYIASIACNIARAHWYAPAQWLYYHLLDADIASNTCSWQWVAAAFGTKKYFCNQENINRYTNTEQYHTFLDHSYEQLPLQPVPGILQEATDLSFITPLPATALPYIDTSKPTLLYNSYNLDPLWRKNEQVNRVLLLEPSHFTQHPVSSKLIKFILDLAINIDELQVYCGEVSSLTDLYNGSAYTVNDAFISKEHPAFTHYPGKKDQRDWLYPQVEGHYPSFFKYWKQCQRQRVAVKKT